MVSIPSACCSLLSALLVMVASAFRLLFLNNDGNYNEDMCNCGTLQAYVCVCACTCTWCHESVCALYTWARMISLLNVHGVRKSKSNHIQFDFAITTHYYTITLYIHNTITLYIHNTVKLYICKTIFYCYLVVIMCCLPVTPTHKLRNVISILIHVGLR
jgi:hypothetical protein